MNHTVSRGEQVLLFINRRGFSAAMVCPGCGKVLRCKRCDRSLTYHKAKGLGLCHWCGFTMKLPEICPSCGCLDMKPIGMGTEQVIASVEKTCADKRLMRMDSDEITSAAKLTTALDSIRAGHVDIIVGTQMISKGHDFPNLTLVGVIYTEQLLHMPGLQEPGKDLPADSPGSRARRQTEVRHQGHHPDPYPGPPAYPLDFTL